jgi:hypothetical protein
VRRLVLLIFVALTAACAADGTDRTDAAARQATGGLQARSTVLGYAHAVLDRAQGAGEPADVLSVKEFGDVGRGTMVVRFTDPGTTGVFSSREDILACYEITLQRAGPVGEPRRVRCPEGATPLKLAPDPAQALPEDTGARLERLLGELPTVPAETDVVAVLRPLFGAAGPPSALFELRGGDVGIAVNPGGGQPCLLASRRGGQIVVVERPIEVLGCTASDALPP